MAALATVSDVGDRLARALTVEETERAEGLLDEASALVVGYLGEDPTDTSVEPAVVPSAVAVVVSRMVARVIARGATAAPAEVDAQSVSTGVGPFQRSVTYGDGATSSSPWLAAVDKMTLRPYKAGGGFTSIGSSSGRSGQYRREV